METQNIPTDIIPKLQQEALKVTTKSVINSNKLC